MLAIGMPKESSSEDSRVDHPSADQALSLVGTVSNLGSGMEIYGTESSAQGL